MYEFIEGSIEHINPAYVIVNNNGIGYHILISINTYEKIKTLKQFRILIHQAIKEDAHMLYGFAEPLERDLFRLLILVNGVGTNTARMILSGQSIPGIVSAISNGNLNMLKSVKGVGPKTAQRIIIELQDKVVRLTSADGNEYMGNATGKAFEEALAALLALGFPRVPTEKVLAKIHEHNEVHTVEDIIKQALKLL
ncbi:MAG: Holliday junction branch migration protein RuvA [Chitinophagaceae bacterium]